MFVQNGEQQRFNDIKYEYVSEDAKNNENLARIVYCRYRQKLPTELYTV